jgi:hypothetical protein
MAEAYLAGQQMTGTAVELVDRILPQGTSSITLPVPARAVLLAMRVVGTFDDYGRWEYGYLVLKGKNSPCQSLSSDGLTLSNSDASKSFYVIIIK